MLSRHRAVPAAKFQLGGGSCGVAAAVILESAQGAGRRRREIQVLEPVEVIDQRQQGQP